MRRGEKPWKTREKFIYVPLHGFLAASLLASGTEGGMLFGIVWACFTWHILTDNRAK